MKRLILSLFCLGAALTASAQAVRPVSTAQAAPGVAQRYVDLVTSSDLFIDGQVGVLSGSKPPWPTTVSWRTVC